MLSYAEMAAEIVDHFIDHQSHGYSQVRRDGDGTVEALTLSDGTTVEASGGDRDCSRLIQTAYAVIGVLPRGIHFYTGNEREILARYGFVEVPVPQARRGDVLWRRGHTEMHLGRGMQRGARIDERGGITGRSVGDQTGYEISRSAFAPGSWSSAYRYDQPRPEPARPAGAKARPYTGQEADEMVCIIQPNEERYLEYFDGTQVHPPGHPDEATALDKVYQATHDGRHIPTFMLGTKGAPWATRLHDALRSVM